MARETSLRGEVQIELMLSETRSGDDNVTVTLIKARDLDTKVPGSYVCRCHHHNRIAGGQLSL